MPPFNIILVEDHPVFRKLVRQELAGLRDLQIIGEVEDGLQLLEILLEVQPDLIILDISMPNLGGLEAARIIKEQNQHIKILFLTMHKNPAYIAQARLIGVEGYILKEELDQDLALAIKAIRRGQTHFPVFPPSLVPLPSLV